MSLISLVAVFRVASNCAKTANHIGAGRPQILGCRGEAHPQGGADKTREAVQDAGRPVVHRGSPDYRGHAESQNQPRHFQLRLFLEGDACSWGPDRGYLQKVRPDSTEPMELLAGYTSNAVTPQTRLSGEKFFWLCP